MVKIGENKKRKLSIKHKLNENRGEFINFVEIEGEYAVIGEGSSLTAYTSLRFSYVLTI